MKTRFAALLAGSLVAHAAAPTFNREIAPVLFENCAPCHRPGQAAPFPLLNYQDAAKHAHQIVEVTSRKLMPPWLPDPAYGHYQGERILSEAQIRLFADWVGAGVPEGDAADLPALPSFSDGWTLGTPDLVVKTPVFDVPADGRDVYRNFVVPLPITRTQYVAAVEFDPGNRRVAHHAFILLDRTRTSRDLDAQDSAPGFNGMDIPETAASPDGHFLSWQPGKRFSRNPEGMSWRMYPGSDLVLQLHMQPSGKPETIQCSTAFYFTDQPPRRFPQKLVLTSYKLDLPPGEAHYEVTNSFKVPVDLDVTGVLPHAHYLGKDLQGYVLLPDGRTNWIIRIRDWNFNWQGDYRLQSSVFAPRGSTLVMRFIYDNSAANPHNPHNPPVRVRYGLQTVDEMAELWLQALPRHPEELPRLREAVDQQTFDFAIDYAEYRLALNPRDARAHVKYGQALLAKRKIPEAEAHFAAAADADPQFDEPHYFLGVIARVDERNDAAVRHFREAARLNPNNARAFGNLGLTFLDSGNLAEAEKNFRRALELDPKDAIAHDRLAVIAFNRGDLKQARFHIEEAFRLSSDDAEIREHFVAIQAAQRRQGANQ